MSKHIQERGGRGAPQRDASLKWRPRFKQNMPQHVATEARPPTMPPQKKLNLHGKIKEYLKFIKENQEQGTTMVQKKTIKKTKRNTQTQT